MISVDHFSLAVSDIDPAIAFFSDAFGYRLHFVERQMTDQIASMLGHDGAQCDLVQMVRDGLPKLELISFRDTGDEEATAKRPTLPGMAHVAFSTPDFDKVLARLFVLGATPVGHVTQFSDGRAIYLATPFGLFIELEESQSTA